MLPQPHDSDCCQSGDGWGQEQEAHIGLKERPGPFERAWGAHHPGCRCASWTGLSEDLAIIPSPLVLPIPAAMAGQEGGRV